MSDADHYLKATLEIDDKLQDPALWAKAMALCEGNIKKSKYLYIKLRVEMLLADEKLVKVEQSNIPDQNLETKRNDELVEVSQTDQMLAEYRNLSRLKALLESYITVDAYSKKSGIKPSQIIAMVRAGSHEGQLVKGEWRVSPNDGSTTKPKPFEYGGRVIYDSLEDKKKALRLENETTDQMLAEYRNLSRLKAIEGYISVDAYSKKSGIKPSQIITMVRAGSHEGQLVKGEWRVSPNDASTTKPKPFEYGGRVFPDSLEDKKKAEDKKALTMSNVKKKALEDKKKTQEDKKEALNKALLESYITVEDFSKKSGIKPSQIISMVRGGSHEGRLVNGQWLVSPDSSSLPKDKLNSLHKPNDTTVLEVIREDAEGYITVEAYSEKYGIKASQVINMIEAGYNEGKLVDGELLVRTDVEATSRYKTITSTIEINRPLNWCYFWNYGLLPLNFFVDLIFVLGGQQIFAMSPAIMLALLVHGSMAAALVIGLHKRTEWAWTLNGYFLVFSVLLQVTGKYGHKGVGDIIVWVIMLAIVWLWPNHVYWTKRKHLFNT